MSNGKVLLVDHDRETVYQVRSAVLEQDFDFRHALTASAGLQALLVDDPDIVVTEWQLRDDTGPEFLGAIRERSKVPVVVLTGAGDCHRVTVQAFASGADDVVFKPARIDELLPRLRAWIARYVPESRTPLAPIRIGPLVVDRARRQVALDGAYVHTSPTEFEILRVLAENAGRVLNSRDIAWRVWGRERRDANGRQEVTTYLFYLRKILREQAPDLNFFETLPQGQGYRMLMEPRRRDDV